MKKLLSQLGWHPGAIIEDRLLSLIIKHVFVPYVRRKLPTLPGTDAELETFLLTEIEPELKAVR